MLSSSGKAAIVLLSGRARYLVSFSRCVVLLGHNATELSKIAIVHHHGLPGRADLSDLSPEEIALATRALDTLMPAVDDLRQPRAACYPLCSSGTPTPLGVLIFIADRATYSLSDLRTVQALTDACASVIARIGMGAALQAMADGRGVALANEQEAHARADAANQAKDQFLATLSHEMRTPLNAILSWAQMLQRAPALAEGIRHGLAAIERSAKDQRRLIEDLLDTASIVSGRFGLVIASVNLRTIIDDAVTAIAPAAAAKQLLLETDAEDAVMRGDATRLQQVCSNLLTNAVTFTDPGGVITVATRRTPDCISIHVTDTGIGIPPELLLRVFDRFSQGDGSSRRGYGGLGLGLSIVRHIAEFHGGTVVATSPGSGLGTTVRVTLPLSIADEASVVGT